MDHPELQTATPTSPSLALPLRLIDLLSAVRLPKRGNVLLVPTRQAPWWECGDWEGPEQGWPL